MLKISAKMSPRGPQEAPYGPQEGPKMAPNRMLRLAGGGPFSASFFKNPLRPILDPSWAHLGPILGPTWPHLGPIWGSLGLLGSILGPSWPHLGPIWAILGQSWAYFRLTWALLGHLGVIWPATWVSIGALLGHLVTNEVALDHVVVALGPLP